MRRLLVFASVLLLVGAERGRLLKIPRIYNALITSDEMLLPSQAYPAVSPVLRPAAPAAHFYFPAPEQEVIQEPPNVPNYPFPTIEQEQPLSEQVKNNKPINTSIPDVPPPPIPGSRSGENRSKRPPPPPFPFI